MLRFNDKQIDQVAKILMNDGVVSVPTDTVYGVCARVSKKAQENLREVKNRPATKAFPIMCKDIEQVKEIAIVDDRAKAVMEAFMPGPLTVILKKKDDLEEYVNGGMDTVAIRLATSDALYALIDAVNAPIFMTSANQSGQEVSKNLDEIERNCPLLQGMLEGDVTFGDASTIVNLSGDEVVVLRKGPITIEEINEVLK